LLPTAVACWGYQACPDEPDAPCQRSGGITELVHGMHAREDDGLCRYKDWLGLPVVRLPAKVRMLPGVASVIRHRKPHSYYRLTGR